MLEALQTTADTSFLYAPSSSTDEKAQKIKQLLLELSRTEDDKELKSVFRQTAEFLRESFFGLTEKQVRSRIVETLRDYYDGAEYNALEIDNLSEETGIRIDVLLPVIQKMVAEGILLEGLRRRWQEPGKHYNPIYKLSK